VLILLDFDSKITNFIDYVSSKGAVITLTKALAIELAPSKISVNTINPAAADTPMLPLFFRGTLEEIKKSAGSALPLGRLESQKMLPMLLYI